MRKMAIVFLALWLTACSFMPDKSQRSGRVEGNVETLDQNIQQVQSLFSPQQWIILLLSVAFIFMFVGAAALLSYQLLRNRYGRAIGGTVVVGGITGVFSYVGLMSYVFM